VSGTLLGPIAGYPVLDGVAAMLFTMPMVLVACLRQYLRYRAERERWRAVERLANAHGPEVLEALPNVARELRCPNRSAASDGSGLQPPDA